MQREYRILQQSDPATAKHLLGRAQQEVKERWRYYKQLSEMNGVMRENVIREA